MAHLFIVGQPKFRFQTYCPTRSYNDRYKLHTHEGNVKLAVRNYCRYHEGYKTQQGSMYIWYWNPKLGWYHWLQILPTDQYSDIKWPKEYGDMV
jgi:hypothetical protein